MTGKTTPDPLLWRFSLYGFLKNQQYYEPFFLLVLQAKGLSFFQIGLLFSFREICVNLMSVPAGFLADLHGRRKSLLVCFSSYILAFAGFGCTRSFPWLFASMFAFAVGESFRSGTHKAMIFHHLRLEGRDAEKPRIYGFTRSWSKLGSSVSALVSGFLVLATGAYERAFLFCIPPYLLNILNVGFYPSRLEGEPKRESIGVRETMATMLGQTRECLAQPRLRALFLQSAAIHSLSKTAIGYLQPLVVGAIGMGMVAGPFGGLDPIRRTALALGVLYFGLNLLAALASRKSHRFEALSKSRFPYLWAGMALSGLAIVSGVPSAGTGGLLAPVALTGFVLLACLENIWRPLLMDRMDEVADDRFTAAVLSVEAQLSSLAVMLGAPILGKVADRFGLAGVGWCVVGVGLLAGSIHLLAGRSRPGHASRSSG